MGTGGARMKTATETVATCTRSENCLGRRCPNGVTITADTIMPDLTQCCEVVTRPTREALEAENAGLRREIKGLRSALVVAQNASRRGW
ncbi:MAG: hypothetical protein CK431_10270 [Mycobacterium sp.]|nr:MAG: hypothetical protein CK431_10270 [Mycobacterium sp.]